MASNEVFTPLNTFLEYIRNAAQEIREKALNAAPIIDDQHRNSDEWKNAAIAT
ncbi:hypothetical protein WJ0W_006015 [Paenibacillus melissococcoides]|uniref:Uncharacterized protein n=1 Tax=Paenibacillus melissococcoides TaxID=2912268 RepID=A0ABN8UCA1_9BACL|nr:hypothetical protein [Paenibacillus melissococcoides]CAH8248831.1 hypothetical protein WJ0W_006015 [Paenibacillus melissococcoides]